MPLSPRKPDAAQAREYGRAGARADSLDPPEQLVRLCNRDVVTLWDLLVVTISNVLCN
uniref:Uncharacterized protein n=1 Tax=Arundo donax TaxID=35708 RepID=A0A0A9C474_ARUDO